MVRQLLQRLILWAMGTAIPAAAPQGPSGQILHEWLHGPLKDEPQE